MITSFGESIYGSKVNIGEAKIDQTNLFQNMVNFNNKSRSKTKEGKAKKNTFDSISALYEVRELNCHGSKYGILSIKGKKGKGRPSELLTSYLLKMLSPKQMH